MKNIIVGILVVSVFAITGWVASNGGAYNGGKHGVKVIADIGDNVSNKKTQTIIEKDDREKENDALTALRNQAGTVSAFDVSEDYDRKCSSCHGINGSGFQNGKKMMGPKLFGQTSEELYKKLIDFKEGRKENVIMKGLLISLSKEDLKVLADEVGDFPARALAKKNEK